ncbi:hypothetical protein CROQUDRAFT_201075 [Cronartium quercuum f. sp. fusiforme G11]|uniref:Uncharacterized protein n=1 Tax=Cronartium quercuum f. sp. fusiforme G11 TaxID=708437 RepID=A0A9P6NFC0_9BASI|nr:hypothetical protein CROQUDRAFT_201075 [Cronartium quercuum f. sp. fusiforme G11]
MSAGPRLAQGSAVQTPGGPVYIGPNGQLMTAGPQGASLGSVVLPGVPDPRSGGQNNGIGEIPTIRLTPPVAPVGGQPLPQTATGTGNPLPQITSNPTGNAKASPLSQQGGNSLQNPGMTSAQTATRPPLQNRPPNPTGSLSQFNTTRQVNPTLGGLNSGSAVPSSALGGSLEDQIQTISNLLQI